MSVYKRGDVWWYSFIFAGRRVQESAKTTSKSIARKAEADRRRALERTLAGLPAEDREDRIKAVRDVVDAYERDYEVGHRPGSVKYARKRLAHVRRVLGSMMLPDLTEGAVRDYIRLRLKEGASGRTINMELGELSRAIGQKWSVLWPKIRRLEERKDIGRALSPEEQEALLSGALDPGVRSPMLHCILYLLLNTGMRDGEAFSLTWGQVDLTKNIISVGRAKTSSGTGRQIPMNRGLVAVIRAHRDWYVHRFGGAAPEHYLFPFGAPTPQDPTRPVTDISSSWERLRDRTGVRYRLHDLRHTFATDLAEAGVPESTMLAMMGHMSRAMLERYSHIRLAAKREAVEAVESRRNPKPVSTISTTVPAGSKPN